MKAIFLIIGFSLIATIAGMNVSLLWNGGVIGQWMSEILSSFAVILPLIVLLFNSKITWILISKLVALITFAHPIIISEYAGAISSYTKVYALPLNIILVILCIASIREIHRKPVNETITK